jgi:hypothetical protein
MTTTITGFDGTIDESAFSRGQSLANARAVVASRSSFAATPVANARQLRISGGTAWDAGVLIEDDAAIAATVNIPGPSAGQWFLIVQRRDWDLNQVTYEVLSADTTTTTEPTIVPFNYPAEFQDKPGIVTDQALYWAWVRSGLTAVQLVDLRKMPPSVEKRGGTSLKNAYYGPAPTFAAARRFLQGAEWFNTDSNLYEVYMAVTNDATNRGGVDVTSGAGWYFHGSNGHDPVILVESEVSQSLRAGTAMEIADVTYDWPQGRLVRLVHWVRWLANGNSAGVVSAQLDDGAPIASMRVHSEGGPVRMGLIQLEHILWLPAGKHRLSTFFRSDTRSAVSYKQEATITAYSLARG